MENIEQIINNAYFDKLNEGYILGFLGKDYKPPHYRPEYILPTSQGGIISDQDIEFMKFDFSNDIYQWIDTLKPENNQYFLLPSDFNKLLYNEIERRKENGTWNNG